MDPFGSPLQCTCDEEGLHATCLGAWPVRTDDGWSLAGPFSEHRETRQLRTRAVGRDGLGRWSAARVYGWPRLCETERKKLKNLASDWQLVSMDGQGSSNFWKKLKLPTVESSALLLVGWSENSHGQVVLCVSKGQKINS